MLDFTGLKVHTFISKITERKETVIIERKVLWKFLRSLYKKNLQNVTKNCELKWKIEVFWDLQLYQLAHPNFAIMKNNIETLTKGNHPEVEDEVFRMQLPFEETVYTDRNKKLFKLKKLEKQSLSVKVWKLVSNKNQIFQITLRYLSTRCNFKHPLVKVFQWITWSWNNRNQHYFTIIGNKHLVESGFKYMM